jgi:DNA-binding CsgD family transcriptional regulator
MSHDIEQKIEVLLEPLYEAAAEGSPRLWAALFKRIADIFASGPAAITLYKPETDEYDVVATTFTEAALRTYNESVRPINPVHTSVSELGPGKSFWRLRDLPDDEFLNSEAYLRFFKKEGVYDIVFYPLFNLDGIMAGLTLSRPSAKTAFTLEDLRAIDFLLPPLRRALRVFVTVMELRHHQARMVETLSQIPRSVIFLDRSAKVVFCNEAATKLVGDKDGLEVDRNGILFASVSKDERRLKAIIASAFDAGLGGCVIDGGVMPVSRPSGHRPLQVMISVFKDKKVVERTASELALAVIYDPEQSIETVESLFSLMYGLTPAEARLTGMLAKGNSLTDIAEILGVTHDTARTHLKRIFSKTGTNRQSELVALILNSPAISRNL